MRSRGRRSNAYKEILTAVEELANMHNEIYRISEVDGAVGTMSESQPGPGATYFLRNMVAGANGLPPGNEKMAQAPRLKFFLDTCGPATPGPFLHFPTTSTYHLPDSDPASLAHRYDHLPLPPQYDGFKGRNEARTSRKDYPYHFDTTRASCLPALHAPSPLSQRPPSSLEPRTQDNGVKTYGPSG
ncbi:uncharacterized protein EI90DRAFT_3044005 [Cantharellus anzutake]|uniref:uncharacterized protein n=1 Tax=Cantharellus anzutake TaxID=1750568 RepID=UPI0019059D2C|nr:uncharacterized protein EI90DRAFT_3044005 [Cantharellus anzutake]KAF8336884.1 hypothetical protein EI90DRAFT_3044005 [Cantharellus anzutake]